MPVPHDHDMKRAQWFTVDGEGSPPAWFCNCPSSAENRTLRWANQNRDKISIFPPRAPIHTEPVKETTNG